MAADANGLPDLGSDGEQDAWCTTETETAGTGTAATATDCTHVAQGGIHETEDTLEPLGASVLASARFSPTADALASGERFTESQVGPGHTASLGPVPAPAAHTTPAAVPAASIVPVSYVPWESRSLQPWINYCERAVARVRMTAVAPASAPRKIYGAPWWPGVGAVDVVAAPAPPVQQLAGVMVHRPFPQGTDDAPAAVREEDSKENEDEDEDDGALLPAPNEVDELLPAPNGVDERDIALVMGQSGCTRQRVIDALIQHNSDIVSTIMELTM